MPTIWDGDFKYKCYSGESYELRNLYKDQSWDWLHLGRILKFGYDYEFERTPFQGIRRVADFCIPTRSPRSLYEELVGACKATVNRIPYESINILASGGIDSSIIAWIVTIILRQKVNLYHTDNDEYNFFLDLVDGLQQAGAKLGPITLVKPKVTPTDVADAALCFGDPVDLGSLVKQWRVFRALSDVKHLVTGDGADELFGGYRRNKLFDTQMSDVVDELTCYHIPRLILHSRANSIHVYTPFLDSGVMTCAFQTPYAMRHQKLILRELAQQLGLPRSIVSREKKPFVDRPTDVDKYRLELINIFRTMWNKEVT